MCSHVKVETLGLPCMNGDGGGPEPSLRVYRKDGCVMLGRLGQALADGWIALSF